MREAVTLSDALDADVFGGKAAGLAACIGAGFRVPPGVALAAGSPEIGSLMEVLRDDGLDGERLAVRSSAIGEDSARASFAGQLLSVMDVDIDAVPGTVTRVLESARSPQVRAYRRAHGIPGDASIGVVVQRLVASEVSGVLFTRDPLDGSDELVVEAARGPGELVVSGRVTPTGYRMPRDGKLRRRRGVASRGRGPLSPPHLRELVALAARMDAVFPGGSDVEWAIAAGELWVLQRRPITA